MISIGVTQAGPLAGASNKTIQYGYLDQTTGLIYYIPYQQVTIYFRFNLCLENINLFFDRGSQFYILGK